MHFLVSIFFFLSLCHHTVKCMLNCSQHNTTTFGRAIYNECYWFQNPRHVKEEQSCFKHRSEEEKNYHLNVN